jgi:Flp pilus assembly protein CpaB
MKSLTFFLRTALTQFTTLLNVLIRALQIQRRVQLIAVLVVSILIGFFVARTVHSTRATQQQWTSKVSILVTSRNLAAGESLTNENTQYVALPIAIQPPDALTEIPTNARMRLALSSRTTLTSSMIIRDNARIQIPSGWRGVAMPTDLVAPTVIAGDHVDVVTADTVIAAGALVVEVSPTNGITIAVPAESAAVVATASRNGDASLVLAT